MSINHYTQKIVYLLIFHFFFSIVLFTKRFKILLLFFCFILDSERSDECIDFTKLCVFLCVCVHDHVSK
ncbi:hypothetical protein FWK35_00013265 [Aphis craccivora]|uniref:Uncharacterized protein n=1 Tax=Aphis craccivora TaxID=307492 RepID=A0A6G0Y450_APHCR|nr:hypothetical protein FWK35_00013265 [Aphis craccivora]